MIRPLIRSKTRRIWMSTQRSDLVNSGRSALVESEVNKSTPSSPSLAICWKLGAGRLPTGVKSNLKSPV